MNAEAMRPYGMALFDYYKGNHDASLTILRDDGWKDSLPIRTFFRNAQELNLEKIALNFCRGHILDIGAGAGIHSLFLQDRGMPVTAIDISQEAVIIMRERGVKDVQQDDILSFKKGRFDTLLMMGHGIGIVENLKGLVTFLQHTPELVKKDGQILLTSLDIRITNNPIHLEYQKQNLTNG